MFLSRGLGNILKKKDRLHPAAGPLDCITTCYYNRIIGSVLFFKQTPPVILPRKGPFIL